MLHNSLDDQDLMETHSFVYLAKPPNSSDTSATMSPVMRVQSQVDRQPYSRDGDKRKLTNLENLVIPSQD